MKHVPYSRILRTLTALLLAFMMPFNALAATLTMPAALKIVAEQAFMNNTSVDEIVLPEGTQAIESLAFAGCTALLRAVIPASVTFIAEDAFDGAAEALFIDAPADSYAAQWAREHGIATNEPESEYRAELHQYFSTLYVGGNVPEIDIAELSVNSELGEGEVIGWNVEKVSGDDGVNVFIGEVAEDSSYAYVFANDVNAVGESVWRATAELPDGSTWAEEFTVKVENLPEGLPEELDVDYPVYAEVGERFEFRPSELIHNLDAFPNADGQNSCHVAYILMNHHRSINIAAERDFPALGTSVSDISFQKGFFINVILVFPKEEPYRDSSCQEAHVSSLTSYRINDSILPAKPSSLT